MMEGKKGTMPTDSKVDANFQFFRASSAQSVGPRFDGVIHLFEHVYNEDFRFWYGVAHVNLSWGQCRRILEAGDGGFLGVTLTVSLKDDRTGDAHSTSVTIDYENDKLWLWVVGFTPLDKR